MTQGRSFGKMLLGKMNTATERLLRAKDLAMAWRRVPGSMQQRLRGELPDLVHHLDTNEADHRREDEEGARR